MTLSTAAGPVSKRIRFGWVVEAAAIVIIMIVHDLLRNLVTGGRAESLQRARDFTSFERRIGIYWEWDVQHFFLHSNFLVAFWNVYYQWAHFIVPAITAIYLYRKFPSRYVRWRNVFLVMLFATGLLGWAVFPVTPPKYMPHGNGVPADERFIDTQVNYFNIGTQRPIEYGSDGEPTPASIVALGNTYSGMPSHHVSWAFWCVCALWPVIRRRWVRGLLVLHVLLTIGAITVTGNHRFVDIAGSALEVALAFGVVVLGERLRAWYHTRRSTELAVT